jgi:imidazolonepropionase-like amidohydrolase
MKLYRMKLYRSTIAFALLGLAGSQVWGQQAPSVKTVVIRAAHMLDVKTGKTLTGQTIVIQGDKIASVGGDTQVPAGATVIELPNATVLPGLIDAHTHITFTPNFGYSRLAISVPREALTGARTQKSRWKRASARSATWRQRLCGRRLRDAVNAGDVPGPRMLVSGPALSITGGHCDNNLLPLIITRPTAE